jgi:hypothetical protein
MAKGERLPAVEDHPTASSLGVPNRGGRNRLEPWSRSRGPAGRDRLERVVAISWIQWSRSAGMRTTSAVNELNQISIPIEECISGAALLNIFAQRR